MEPWRSWERFGLRCNRCPLGRAVGSVGSVGSPLSCIYLGVDARQSEYWCALEAPHGQALPRPLVPVLATGLHRGMAWHAMRGSPPCVLPRAKHYAGSVLCAGVK